MGWESLVERPEALWESSGGADSISLLALRPWMVWGSSTFSHPKNFGDPLSGASSGVQGALGMSVTERVSGLSPLASWEGPTPQKTSSLVKERYHFTSSLSSNTLSANNRGPPPAGRLFSSAQCWRALAYATTLFPKDFPNIPTCIN